MRLVIFAPHQDDELNLFGTLFSQYIKNGFEITVVYVTNGDLYGIEKTRYLESERIKEIIGINSIFYFGYPDSGSANILEKTIYNCEKNEYVSLSGHSKTYKPYDDNKNNYIPEILGKKSRSYTRSSILSDFTDFLSLFKPEIILSTGWDDHPDHKITSSILSEAIVTICRKEREYRPLYLEGFAYLGNWLGPDDYFSPIPLETKPGKKVNSSFPFPWDKRIQIFVNKNEIASRFWKSKSFSAYKAYASTQAIGHFFRCANTDKCFWVRSTHNLALYSVIRCSTGDSRYLNDFKLLEASNMRIHNFSINNTSLIHWSPSLEDETPTIIINLPRPAAIKTIIIHQGYGNEGFGCKIIINKKEFIYDINKYCYIIIFPNPITSSEIEIKIVKTNNQYIAIREIEVFDNLPDDYLKQFIQHSYPNLYHRRNKTIIFFAKVIRRFYLLLENRKHSKIYRKNK